VGGGGMISGIAAYLKTIVNSNTKIIGVQPYGNCTMYDSIIKGELI
jgi:threonine dehydratase